MEALASGAPVVTCLTGGIGEVIENGVNGLFAEPKNSVDLASKINEILNNPELEYRFRENGPSSVRKYDYSEIAKRFVAIFEKV